MTATVRCNYPIKHKENLKCLLYINIFLSHRMDGEFCTALGIYLGQGLKKDIDTASSGGTVLEGLQALLATTSTNLIQLALKLYS